LVRGYIDTQHPRTVAGQSTDQIATLPGNILDIFYTPEKKFEKKWEKNVKKIEIKMGN